VSVDADGEGGAESCGVFGGLWGEVEFETSIAGESEAEEPASVCEHEVDDVGGDGLGGTDEVAFVFAILVVDEDDHSAGPDVV
jgi:hypothetical protein